MKALVLLFIMLPVIGFCQKTDTIQAIYGSGRQYHPVSYEMKVDNIYMSGLYFKHAGANITAGAVFLGLSACAGVAIALIPADQIEQKTVTACLVAAGGLFTVSIIEFIIGGAQLHKAGFTLSHKKTYTIESCGTSFKIKF